jgi:flagellar hook-associated protein FlgK
MDEQINKMLGTLVTLQEKTQEQIAKHVEATETLLEIIRDLQKRIKVLEQRSW